MAWLFNRLLADEVVEAPAHSHKMPGRLHTSTLSLLRAASDEFVSLYFYSCLSILYNIPKSRLLEKMVRFINIKLTSLGIGRRLLKFYIMLRW